MIRWLIILFCEILLTECKEIQGSILTKNSQPTLVEQCTEFKALRYEECKYYGSCCSDPIRLREKLKPGTFTCTPINIKSARKCKFIYSLGIYFISRAPNIMSGLFSLVYAHNLNELPVILVYDHNTLYLAFISCLSDVLTIADSLTTEILSYTLDGYPVVNFQILNVN